MWSWSLGAQCISKGDVHVKVEEPGPTEDVNQAGDDAYCSVSTENHSIVAIADGVGGWRDRGVDPSVFSRTLLEKVDETADLVDKGASKPAIKVIKASYKALIQAFAQGRDQQPYGSSTICVAVLDRKRGWLDLANLGDSGAVLFRQGHIQLMMERKQSGFNRPVQLALRPHGVLQGDPDLADHEKFKIEDGDCLIMATDGLWDNLFMDQIEACLHKHTERITGRVDEEALVVDLVESARKASKKRDEETPFEQEAGKAVVSHSGGKPDDITVLVARIHKTDLSVIQ